MTPPPPDPASLTHSIRSARADLETAEANIKLAILDAARAGDTCRVIETRWDRREVSW